MIYCALSKINISPVVQLGFGKLKTYTRFLICLHIFHYKNSKNLLIRNLISYQSRENLIMTI